MASLFDGTALIAKLPRYATWTEKLRLAGPPGARFRNIIDSWVTNDPPATRSKIRTDLLDDRNGLGTFHDLLLRQILRCTVGDPEREPGGLPVANRKPDYGIRIGRQRRLIVFESTTVGERVDEQTRRRWAIMSRLDRIPGTWHLLPEWSWSHGLEDISPKRVEQAVRNALAGLEPGAKHRLELKLDQAVLRATVLPAPRHRESIVSMDSSRRSVTSPGVASIYDDIKDKTAKYRGLKGAGIPFVLTIGSDDPLIDWESAFIAMYGNEQVTFAMHDGELVPVDHGRLAPGGRITPRPGIGPIDTTLSALWVVRWLFQGAEMVAEVVHLPNPWAANPVRFPGRDIARVTWRRLPDGRIAFYNPRRLRRLQVS